MTGNFNSQKGLTLVEVLASIVLLSIILITFMGFFTQSSLFTQRNQQKLNTMQMAQTLIKTVDISITKQDLQNNSNNNIVYVDSSGNVINSPRTLTQFDLQTLLGTSLDPNYNVTAVLSNYTDSSISPDNLILFKIIVQDTSNSNKSVTYTYIRR